MTELVVSTPEPVDGAPVEGEAVEEQVHLVHKLSPRGFKHMPRLDGTYGERVTAYESSAADGPHVWINVYTKKDPGMAHSAAIQAAAHMTVDEAWKLAEQLMYLVNEHYQNG